MTDVSPWLTEAENHLTRLWEARPRETECEKESREQSEHTITNRNKHSVTRTGRDRTNAGTGQTGKDM